jgi:multiple sugar transport system permease protein
MTIATVKTRRTLAKAGVITGLIAGALFAGLPVLWMLSTSFKSNGDVFRNPPRLITDTFSFDAYREIFGNAAQLRFFLNSYIVAIAVTVLTLLVALLAGFAFSRFTFPLQKTINAVIVSVQAVPPITLVIPYFGLVVALGLYNTYAGLIFTHMVFTLPYAIIMITAYLNTLPRELDESVKVDGGTSWTALWRILVPISVPGLIAVGVYTFMISWNEYLFALTLTRTDDMRTVPIGIQLLMGQHSYEWNQMMAMSILGSIPVLLLFLLFQRRFIGGLTAGAVKA